MDKYSKIKLFFKQFDKKPLNFNLLFDFFMDFKYPDTWEKDIFPLLENVSSGKSLGVDWTDFVWGSACFRQDYVMFLDKQIHQIGRKFPPILDNNGYPIVDEGGQWLENTLYIEQNYTEYFKISLDEFIDICKRWYNEVISTT
jgi:hypothetical protein